MSFDVLSIIIYALFVIYFLYTIEIYFGYRSIKYLDNIYEYTEDLARISVIIPARNEERNIEKALRSVLSSNYPSFEVIVVNDRSEDRTAEIIKKLQGDYQTLKMVEIDSVPEGWLGKNYALQSGVSCASGNYYLFTDADVIIHKNTLRKAVSYCRLNHLDHIAVVPIIIMPGLILNLFTALFIILFNMFASPWKAKNPKSRKHIGLGAFNLVRSDVYKKIGGHEKIKLRPDDDMKLGKLIKSNGYKQETLFGKDLIEVNWYSSLKETFNGLLKNSYSGVDYNFITFIFSVTGLIFFCLFPFVSVFFCSGYALFANLAIILMIALRYLIISKPHNINAWYFISFPFATLLFLIIYCRSVFYTIIKGKITWKDTSYSLKDLKSNIV